jgi:hypothetical protein
VRSHFDASASANSSLSLQRSDCSASKDSWANRRAVKPEDILPSSPVSPLDGSFAQSPRMQTAVQASYHRGLQVIRGVGQVSLALADLPTGSFASSGSASSSIKGVRTPSGVVMLMNTASGPSEVVIQEPLRRTARKLALLSTPPTVSMVTRSPEAQTNGRTNDVPTDAVSARGLPFLWM